MVSALNFSPRKKKESAFFIGHLIDNLGIPLQTLADK